VKIICIGRNYVAHARELNNELPTEPVVFIKPQSALLINDRPFYYPDFTTNLHFEGELVLRICKNGKHVQPEFAHRYYDAVAFGIDFTARDVQDRLKSQGLPWELAKGFDGAAVLGHWILVDDLPHRNRIRFETKLNGQSVQQGDTDLMIFSLSDIICYVSKFFMLQMGDIVYTGTPAGVGPVQPGDLLEGFIESTPSLTCAIK
jgi:2-keto-4-pentenoate hydratase/2-oxohepta-3-ene-1,7-dioic acid hydratase in catechol pathway